MGWLPQDDCSSFFHPRPHIFLETYFTDPLLCNFWSCALCIRVDSSFTGLKVWQGLTRLNQKTAKRCIFLSTFTPQMLFSQEVWPFKSRSQNLFVVDEYCYNGNGYPPTWTLETFRNSRDLTFWKWFVRTEQRCSKKCCIGIEAVAMTSCWA